MDGSYVIDSHQTHTTDGNHVATKTDSRGKLVTYTTDLAKDTLTSVTDPNGQSVSYTYDSRKRVIGTNATADGLAYKNTYTYENDRLKTVSHNTTSDTPDVTYTFDYDEFGNPTTVKVGTQTLSTNVYTTTGDRTLTRVEYGNGGKVHYTRDDFRRVTGIHYDNATTPRFTYDYGANGQVAYVRDNELNRTAWMEYDTSERPTRVHLLENATNASIGTPRYVSTTSYDEFGNVAAFREKVNDSASYETTYTYDVENKLTQLRYGADNQKVTISYDPIGRISTRTLAGTTNYVTTYAYTPASENGGMQTTPLVASITQPGHNFSYTYDNVGNITGEVHNGKNTTYVYDSLGQLIRYNDEQAGKSWVFTYDRGGNLTGHKQYAYTEGTLGEVELYEDFQYSNANWKDQMTRRVYNGYYNYDMTYDAIGNLTSYAGWTYTWAEGRRLVKQVQDSKTVTYAYDASGLRVKKTYNSTVYDYTWSGSKLVHLKVGNNHLHFFYDDAGSPSMMLYNGVPYRYVKNLQGDIIAIVDSSGTTVVEYKYDPWGKKESRTGSLSGTVGYYNPFRYRGYIFDEETWMYYLKDRYYYPELRRFINADIYLGEPRALMSTNPYCYCKNNAVMGIDSTGNFPSLISIVSSVLQIFVSGAKAENTNSTRNSELANAEDLFRTEASPDSYNCYGNAISKVTNASPSGYGNGLKYMLPFIDPDVDAVFEGVKLDVGAENIQELNGINDPRFDPTTQNLVALRVSKMDYHFIVKVNGTWHDKAGSKEIITRDESYVVSEKWVGIPFINEYDSKTIYFSIRKDWYK